MTVNSTSEINGDLREVSASSNKSKSLDVAAGAIFGALSIAVSAMTTSWIPRVPGWGMAWIDPVSLIWIISFLIFGLRSGLITTIVGTIALAIWDPFLPWGPLMKFSSTIWFIIVPYYIAKSTVKKANKANTKETLPGSTLNDSVTYYKSAAIAMVIRIGVMLTFNVILAIQFGWVDFVSLGAFGLPTFTGLKALIIGAILLNIIQSVADSVVPYLIIYKSGIYESHKLW